MDDGVKNLTDEDLQYHGMENLKHRVHQTIHDLQSDTDLTKRELVHTLSGTDYVIFIKKSPLQL